MEDEKKKEKENELLNKSDMNITLSSSKYIK